MLGIVLSVQMERASKYEKLYYDLLGKGVDDRLIVTPSLNNTCINLGSLTEEEMFNQWKEAFIKDNSLFIPFCKEEETRK